MLPSLRKILRRLSAEVPASAVERAARRTLLKAFGRPLDPDFAILRDLVLPERGTVIDIGANHGFAIDAIRLALPMARIVAFEPNPHAADDLRRTFGESIVIYQCALGAREGVQTLHVPQYGRRVLDGLGSLERSQAESWLRGRTVGSSRVRLTAYEVPVQALDDFDLAPCLIKIDVQGTEAAVVEGAIETIRRHRPVLFVENPDASIVELLRPLGYRKYHLRQGKIDPTAQRSKNALLAPETTIVAS